jgi:hypothetical protein
LNGLYAAAAEIQSFCESRSWRFCFIGGLALVRWGAVRQTQDVDLTLLTGFDDERFIDELLSQFAARVNDAKQFALQNRVILISASNGTPLDVSLGGLPFEEEMVSRSSSFAYLPTLRLNTASAEDMVILKSFAGRTKDWADVESIVERQDGQLDWPLIFRELTPLCELRESPESLDRLKLLRDQRTSE